MNLLNPDTLQRQQQLSQDFAQAQPFKHVVIDDFFKAEFCQQLLDDFPEYHSKDAIDENKSVGKKAVVQSVANLSDSYHNLDQMVQSNEFLTLIEHITGIKGLLYDPHYIGGGTHNNLDGQELDPHVDFTHHPITSYHRRLNLIVYLNHEWHASWGGHIEFHRNPRLHPSEDDITSIEPLFNRAVIFETNNHSWHGFPAIQLPAEKSQLSRKSFALYYYTRQRTDAVEPHSTIYVERHLPETYHAGQQLSAEDLNQLKGMLNRRDQHLTRLYQTITAQTKELSRLKNQMLQLKTLDTTPSKQADVIKRHMELLSFDETRLMHRVQELENSTSWKITAPLRKFKRWFGSSQ